MSEWWTYTLSDFLLFSAPTYHRLFELYNREIWPAQIVALAFGIVIPACLVSAAAWRGRAVAAILAACWLWVAWAFHFERYTTINWAANYFALGFAIEALLLLWMGIVRAELTCITANRIIRIAGICVFVFALIVQPAMGALIGRPWLQAEVFGVAPDPTVVATLGVLMLATRRSPWLLLIIPIIWCVISGATLWVMESGDALVMPLIALLALLVAVRKAWSPACPAGSSRL
jgi:hypothetical protein